LNTKVVSRAKKYQEKMLESQAIKPTLDSFDHNARPAISLLATAD
jgi:hypothetical protein